MLRDMYPDHRATQPMSALRGKWTNPSRDTYSGRAKAKSWFIEVQRGANQKVLGALQAKDGYEADLGFALNASARIYPRFRHKRFSWGEAVSFLVQYQNDNTNCAPNNGMLLYEVHGVTTDRRFAVRAQFGLTHPRIAEFREVRDYRDDPSKPDSPMRRDRDYRLVEHCADDTFQPSIQEIDAMLNTLKPDDSD